MIERLKLSATNPTTLYVVWLVAALAILAAKIISGDPCYNFDTYTSVFVHASHGQCLYEYDPYALLHNHYGVVFSLVIAPFALLPKWVGLVLWVVAGVTVLYWSIRLLGLERWKVVFLMWFCLNELCTTTTNVQYNTLVAAFVVLAFALTERRNEFWATFFIALGGFSKIYGFGALVFFLFARDKKKFVWSFLMWCGLFAVLPMVLYGFDYTVQCYRDWALDLSLKSGQNMFNESQNVSVVGMVRKISGSAAYSDLWVVLPAMLLYLVPLVRWRQYASKDFRLSVLASTLMFIVLFSNGSESSTYLIPFVGVALWFVASPQSTGRLRWVNIALVGFVFVFSSLSPTDLFPRALYRGFMVPYALKALPVALVWLKLLGEMTLCRYPKTLEE